MFGMSPHELTPIRDSGMALANLGVTRPFLERS